MLWRLIIIMSFFLCADWKPKGPPRLQPCGKILASLGQRQEYCFLVGFQTLLLSSLCEGQCPVFLTHSITCSKLPSIPCGQGVSVTAYYKVMWETLPTSVGHKGRDNVTWCDWDPVGRLLFHRANTQDWLSFRAETLAPVVHSLGA